MPKAYLHTLGCRLNQAETAIIASSLKKKGYDIVGEEDAADLTVINTCTVTEQADAKCRQAVRRSIRKNPDTIVAVVGCYAQMAVDTIRQIEGVDLIIGNEHKLKLAEYIDGMGKRSEPTVVHSAKISREEFVIESTGLYDTHTRANIKIQDGCSYICSFCIVATARGPARSRKFDDILSEARQLVDMGFKEIVLTGVNIGTYQQEGKTFLDVLRFLEKIDGLRRIRISSIEPTTVDESLIDYMAGSEKLCRYLHIPLQSGDDRILDSMRRKHTAADFRRIVEYAAKKIPDIGLGTDIMVGYPGEGREEFVNTKKLVTDLPLAYFHVFTYSDRKGTTAYNLKPKVDSHTKKERTRIMIEVGQRKKYAFYQSFINRELEVLFEEEKNGRWEGFSDNYLRVGLKSAENLKNEIKRIKVISEDMFAF
ncbi:MAG TPA: tRNA (N(6)-L-threonylcarbamoyladenosine(37)-C(2))-methylthiotransferase MtaB [Calditrichaeota bacterium]|nr:tRNA (N(6)-L-threonylcarbamoyladenosine(37)-C(2))-methylthiotransferase MtaB [Calditrichota bacterium]